MLELNPQRSPDLELTLLLQEGGLTAMALVVADLFPPHEGNGPRKIPSLILSQPLSSPAKGDFKSFRCQM